MSTSTITHHPAPFAAAAAAVVAVALAVVGVSIAHDSGSAVAPTDPVQVVAAPHHGGHFEYSSSGGKVMIGQ
jgi:streptogramin lyase